MNKSSVADPVGLLSQTSACVLGVLDSLRCGGFLLDGIGRVLSFNDIGLECLGEGLLLSGERLRIADPVADQRLQRVIGSALRRVQGQNTVLSIAVQRRTRLPLMIRIVRLDGDASRTPDSAVLLLLVLDPGFRQEPPPEILTQAFELTRAESDVAIGILSGKTLAEIAATRGVKIGTVRTHSKAVFSKTHTRGQADLTGVLTRLAFVVPDREDGAAQSPPNTRKISPQHGAELVQVDGRSDKK